MRAARVRRWVVGLTVVLTAAPAAAQTNLQLWGNLTLDWVRSDRLVYELDLEPKALLVVSDGQADWRNLDVTPNAEYSPKAWLDLVAESSFGYTKQTDDVNTWEVTPRVGARFHLFSRAVPTLPMPERPPSRRIVVRDLVRVESRNFFYTGEGSGSDSSVRFRNRLEFLLPLNRERLSDDGARYLLADWEWFIPLGEPSERFANKQRIRAGIGLRRSFPWRYELLYVWTRPRNTVDEGFTTSDHSINVRLKLLSR
jgi:hypothetical protein